MSAAVLQQVTSAVPNFDTVLAAGLQFVGFPGVLVAAVVLAYALESWYTNVKRFGHGAAMAGSAAVRGSRWLAGLRPVQIVVTVATTITVVAAQVVMVRLSYVVGSALATAADPVRWKSLSEIYGPGPRMFTDPGLLARIGMVNVISVAYVLMMIALVLLAYRKNAHTRLLWCIATTPFCLLLFGGVVIAIFCVGFEGLMVILYHLTGGPQKAPPYDWALTMKYVLDPELLTAYTLSAVYCVVAIVAIGGAAAVRRLWTNSAEKPA